MRRLKRGGGSVARWGQSLLMKRNRRCRYLFAIEEIRLIVLTTCINGNDNRTNVDNPDLTDLIKILQCDKISNTLTNLQ
jgi:hypothetical protein